MISSTIAIKNSHYRRIHTWRIIICLFVTVWSVQVGLAQRSGDPIWSPLGPQSGSQKEVYFRKSFTLINPAEAQLRVEASGVCDVYLNSRLVQRLSAGEIYENQDISRYVQPGLNLLAIRVAATSNNNSLKSYFRLREQGENRWRSVSTDDSWLTSETAHEMWQSVSFPDRGWIAATAPGSNAPEKNVATRNLKSGTSPNPATQNTGPVPAQQVSSKDNMLKPRGPVDSKVAETAEAAASNLDKKLAARNTTTMPSPDESTDAEHPQFTVPAGFEVHPVVAYEECGSAIAMAFDEAGRLIVSRESGGLLAIDLSAKPGSGRAIEICNDVTSCQGVLPLNGNIYVTGNGPQGVALYELKRVSSDGNRFTVERALITFTGQPGEHGPHGLTLGPDGKIYCVVGNGTRMTDSPGPNSPFRQPIDIDLVPRVEDPGGHATGVKAPGGTVVRVGLDGKNPEIVAGGIRNAYDLAFNEMGDLFVHDSDMESDMGMAWHRSTQLFHVPLGADLGWRSGWANCAAHCFDTTPAIADTGRGSPTGAVCYRHMLFPARYHDALFLADWSEGRILTATLEAKGSSYSVATETFLTGRPMNVTDLAIGEDGSLFFCTGGRGTWGGVFRVTWTGNIPAELLEFESDIARALRTPQPDSAWARQNLALLSVKMGPEWSKSMVGAALERRNSTHIRLRAIETLYLYACKPNASDLTSLLEDANPAIRARAARLCGTMKTQSAQLIQLLNDDNLQVRLAACEALLDSNASPTIGELQTVLADDDRNIALAAMRLLQRQPVESWFQDLVHHENVRTCIMASMAAMSAQPDLALSYEVLAECSVRIQGFVNDRDFTDMLRLIQVALARGEVDPARIPAFADQMKREFPSSHPVLNTELAKVLVALNTGSFGNAWIDYLAKSSDPVTNKTEIAMYLAAKSSILNDQERLAVIDFLCNPKTASNVGNQRLYAARAVQKAANELSDKGCDAVLARGADWPQALPAVFFKIENGMTPARATALINIDKKLRSHANEESIVRSRLGIIALLAQTSDETSMEYLRTLWRDEENRRLEITIGLAQQPAGKNWSYLVASLPLLDDLTGAEVVKGLLTVPQRPVDPRHYRDLIELGFRLGNSGAHDATALVNHWADMEVAPQSADWKGRLQHCTEWYSEKWPADEPVSTSSEPVSQGAPLSAEPKGKKLSFDQVLKHLQDNPTAGNPEHGMQLFVATKCADCHRFGTLGDSSGPDLTSLANRFSRRETLEAIVHPNKFVPPQFRSTQILTTSGQTIVGLEIENADGTVTIIQSTGERTRIAKTGIESKKLVESSSMPEGLIDDLDLQEISDLFAYMYGKTSAEALPVSAKEPQVSGRDSKVQR